MAEEYNCKGCNAPLDVYSLRCEYCGRYHPDLTPLTLLRNTGGPIVRQDGGTTAMWDSTCEPMAYGVTVNRIGGVVTAGKIRWG